MTRAVPITFLWNGEVMTPKQKWQASRQFEVGHEYALIPHEERSSASHAHYFAALREAWSNLPEIYGKQHPDVEHLRKYALIKTGWSIKRNVVCESVDQAHAVAALAGALDESAVILVQGTVVTIATARSQKTTGIGCMNREEFQKSKQDVLDYCASLIGVSADTLSAQVPHSSDASEQANSDRTDRPAAESPGPQSVETAAGVSNSNWFDFYIGHLTRHSDEALSLLNRHAKAMQDGLAPLVENNENRLAVMRQAWRLVRDRNEQAISVGEYDLRLARLRAIATGSRHAA